jgi:RecA/RadA recombinase
MEINERRKKLMETVKSFNKDNKSEVFTLGSEIVDTPIIATGIKAVDDAIGGGVKRGGHTIIYGQFSVGKTALIMHLVANAQREGLNVCYVNTEKPISPDRFKFFGVDLDTLLYIEAPENAEIALEALRTLCKDKVIDLFIIDSTNGLCPISVQSKVKGEDVQERGLDKKNVAALPMTLSNFYNVVNAQVFRAKAAVVWIGQLRTKGIGSYITMDGLTGGNAQTFYAYQIIKLRHGQKADNPKIKVPNYFLDPDGKLRKETKSHDSGYDVVVKIDKTNSSKSLKQGEEIHVPYYYDSGFAQPKEEDNKFTIEGTDEQKDIIRQKLIEKGVMKSENPHIGSDFDEFYKKEIEPTLVPPTIEVNERKFTKEESVALDILDQRPEWKEPKRRGRKPGTKNKEKK